MRLRHTKAKENVLVFNNKKKKVVQVKSLKVINANILYFIFFFFCLYI